MRQLIDAAIHRRDELASEQTDALRLIDGAGDGLPGVELDDFAGRWLLSLRDPDALDPDLRDALAPRGHPLHLKRLDDHHKTSPRHLAGPVADAPFAIREHGVRFEVSFQAGYSQGIFLDQRDNRARLRQRLRPGATLLNTFAYTGAFSVVAALAGATATTLDLSQPYLDWARRNFALNQLDPAAHHFCKGDTFHWLRRFAKQGRRFDAIVLDPPTFSRDDRGGVFRVARDYGRLVELAQACLAPDGFLLACTNCRQLAAADFIDQVRATLPHGTPIESAPMPPDFTATPYLKSLWIH